MKKFGKRQMYRIQKAEAWARIGAALSLKTALDETRQDGNRTAHLYIARNALEQAQIWLQKAIDRVEEADERGD